MIASYRTHGFIFQKEDRLEADCLFSVFTKEFGRVEIFAKAFRKINAKLRSQSSIFSLVELEFIQGKKKKTLTDVCAANQFNRIKQEPKRLAVAYRVAQLVSRVVKGQEADEAIFNLLLEIFTLLDDVSLSKISLVFEYFFWNFMVVLGYAPVVMRCAHCGGSLKENALFFSCLEGGVLCQNCVKIKKDSLRVSANTIKILRLIINKDWTTLSRIKFDIATKNSLTALAVDYQNSKF